MRYIELINFEKALPQVELKLFKKLNYFRSRGVPCVVWQEGNPKHSFRPDISIIYAPRLSDQAMMFLVERIRSEIPILYGSMRAVSNSLLISSFDELDRIIFGLKDRKIFVTDEMSQCLFGESNKWNDTVPLGLF